MEAVAIAMDAETRRRLIEAVARRIIDHADELTALDQAIGDGDHGLNMRRGAEAVLADLDKHAAAPLPDAVKAIGMTLVMKVGGASGPLYGTLLMALGKELPAEPSHEDLARASGAAFVAGGDAAGAAATAAEATIPMKAIRGRASFLGERSIGHMDPGARSSALMIAALCEVLERA